MTLGSIPPDFPRAAHSGGVPGAQPKVLAREAGGRFVGDPSERDIRARYVMCEDLALQLVAYTARKRTEDPSSAEAQLRDKVARAVRQKAFGWGLSPAETEWVLGRVAVLVPSPSPRGTT